MLLLIIMVDGVCGRAGENRLMEIHGVGIEEFDVEVPCSLEDFERIETDLKIELPERFKAIMTYGQSPILERNAIRINVPFMDEPHEASLFFLPILDMDGEEGYYCRGLISTNEHLSNQSEFYLPDGVVVFGDDGGGGLFSFEPDDKGELKVLFSRNDWPENENFRKIAESFDDLLNRLGKATVDEFDV